MTQVAAPSVDQLLPPPPQSQSAQEGGDEDENEMAKMTTTTATTLEQMLQEAEQLARKMSQQSTGAMSSSDVQEIDDMSNSSNSSSNNNINSNRNVAASTKMSKTKDDERLESNDDLEELLRKSEALLGKMRSRSSKAVITAAAAAAPGERNAHRDKDEKDDNNDKNEDYPSVQTCDGVGGNDHNGPPSPSAVRPPLYSPTAPTSVYVLAPDSSGRSAGQDDDISDEVSSMEESSSLFLRASPMDSSSSVNNDDNIAVQQQQHPLPQASAMLRMPGLTSPLPSGGAATEGTLEANGGGGDDDDDEKAPTKKRPLLVRPRYTLEFPNSGNGDNVVAEDDNKRPQPATNSKPMAAAGGAIYSETTPTRKHTSAPVVDHDDEPNYHTVGSLPVTIPDFSQPSPGATWEKVTSAQTEDEDYVPLVDYSKMKAGVGTPDATAAAAAAAAAAIRPMVGQNQRNFSFDTTSNTHSYNDDDNYEDDEDDDDDDDLTDEHRAGPYSVRVQAFRSRQKRLERKRRRRLIRAFTALLVVLVGLRYLYSTQNGSSFGKRRSTDQNKKVVEKVVDDDNGGSDKQWDDILDEGNSGLDDDGMNVEFMNKDQAQRDRMDHSSSKESHTEANVELPRDGTPTYATPEIKDAEVAIGKDTKLVRAGKASQQPIYSFFTLDRQDIEHMVWI